MPTLAPTYTNCDTCRGVGWDGIESCEQCNGRGIVVTWAED